jgi:hypothetical protein
MRRTGAIDALVMALLFSIGALPIRVLRKGSWRTAMVRE